MNRNIQVAEPIIILSGFFPFLFQIQISHIRNWSQRALILL